MNKLRYPDKKILCKYDLSEEFFSQLGIEVEDIIPLRKVFILTTDKGKKILKITDSSEERLDFIDKSLSYVSKEYKDILSYCKNKNNKIFERWNGNTYILLDMIDGREATFSNPLEIEICSRAIAKMHKASTGISCNINSNLLLDNRGQYLPEYFERCYDEIIALKNRVSKYKYKNNFDELFLENSDYYIEQIKIAKSLLALSDYNSVLRDESKKVLCHNDLAHHNFIVDGDKVKIIDFDYCCIDTRIVDIANYSIKVIKNFAYDMEKFKSVIDSYNAVEELSKEEIKVLYCIINFPKDFVNIVTDYYNRKKTWEEEVFFNRFYNKSSNEIYRKEFLDNFPTVFSKYFY